MNAGHLYLWPGRLLWATPSNVNRLHRHFAATLLLSTARDFELQVQATRYRGCAYALIDANTWFCVTSDTPQIVVHVDPDQPEYTKLAARLDGAPWRQLDRKRFAPVRSRLQRLQSHAFDCGQASTLLADVIEAASAGCESDVRSIHPKVRQTIRYLRARVPEITPISEIVALTDLSESRLMHLFKQEMGLPLRRFQVCLRAHYAAALLARGESLADLALAAGFADQAHVTRCIRAVYGLTPGHFFRRTHVMTCP